MVAFATQVKRRRGTTAQNDTFTGAEGEIVVDTQKHTLRVHDGLTQGGFEIARTEDINELNQLILSSVMSAGIVSAFAGKTAPSGWLKCDGSAISRTLYADLFAAIGSKYGSGDGSTSYNLPTQSVLPLGSEAPVAIYGNGNSLTLISKDNTPVTLLGGLSSGEYQGYAGVGAYTGITTPGTPQAPINPGVDNSTLGLSTDPFYSGISGVADLTRSTGGQAIACIKY